MGGSNNLWARGAGQITTSIAEATSYLMVMNVIHVLLVDHDYESLVNTSKMLELCQYTVTLVELASAAIHMLSAGKVKIDMIMVNVNSPDLHVLKLLQLAANMDIPIIVMSDEEDGLLAMRALESGAFLFLKRPITIEMLKCQWQYIALQKIQAASLKERIIAANLNSPGIEFREMIPPMEEFPNNVRRDSHDMLRMDRRENGVGGENYGSKSHMNNGENKKKMCTQWTDELHNKFMDAIEQLGEGRCFPKEIVKLMNVPGLTKMQVASHLQKCRNNNWRSPEERKSSTENRHEWSSFDRRITGPRKARGYGLMPKTSKAGPSEAPGQSEARIQIDGDRVENMEIAPPTNIVAIDNGDNNNTLNIHEAYLPIVPHDAGNNDVADLNAFADGFLNFSDMDHNVVHNFPARFAIEECDWMINRTESTTTVASPSSTIVVNTGMNVQIELGYQTNMVGSSMENGGHLNSKTTPTSGNHDPKNT